MRLTKTSISEIVALAFKQIKLAGVQATITVNPKTQMKFLSLYGDTFPIKDQLSNLGFRYFKGTWGMNLERAKGLASQLAALGIDTSILTSEQATAPATAPAQPAAPIAPAQPAVPQTQTDKTLAEMKLAIDAEIKQGPATGEKAKRMFEFIDKMIDNIAGSVDEAAKQEFVRSFLAFAAKFHNYSFGNQMLIWIQKPDASYVAGFKQWMEKGRQVVNWGNPITIIRPQTNRRNLNDDEMVRYKKSPEERQHQWVSFKPAAVYDVADTQPIAGWKDKEGNGPFEPVKPRTAPNEAEDQITNIVKAAVSFSESLGISVDLQKALEESTGGYSAGKEIAINKAYVGINQLGTLVHEMAHEILHRGDDQKTPIKESKQNKEIDAETTAYIVLKHYGYESKDAPNYIALWRGTGEDVRKRRNEISKAVKIIVEGIDKNMGSVIQFEDESAPEAPPAAPAAPAQEVVPAAAWVRSICKFAQDMGSTTTDETTFTEFSNDPALLNSDQMTGDMAMDDSMQEFNQADLSFQDAITKMPVQIQPEMQNLYTQFHEAAMDLLNQSIAGAMPGPLATAFEKP